MFCCDAVISPLVVIALINATICIKLQTFHFLLLVLQGVVATLDAQLEAEAAFCIALERNAADSMHLKGMLHKFEAQCKASVVTLHCFG